MMENYFANKNEEYKFSMDPVPWESLLSQSSRTHRRPRVDATLRLSRESKSSSGTSKLNNVNNNNNNNNRSSTNSSSILMSTQESMTSHSSIAFGISSSSRIRKTREALPLSINCRQRLSNQSSITSHQSLDEERSRKKSRIAFFSIYLV
jgi:hypothetical protein